MYSVQMLLDDELAAGIEQLGYEGVEAPGPASAVAVHDDDLGRACRRPSQELMPLMLAAAGRLAKFGA